MKQLPLWIVAGCLVVLTGLAVAAVGYVVFKRAERTFADVI